MFSSYKIWRYDDLFTGRTNLVWNFEQKVLWKKLNAFQNLSVFGHLIVQDKEEAQPLQFIALKYQHALHQSFISTSSAKASFSTCKNLQGLGKTSQQDGTI